MGGIIIPVIDGIQQAASCMPGPQEEPEIIASVFLEHLLCARLSSEHFDHTKYLMSVFRYWARRGWVQIQTSVQRYHLLPSHPGLESLGSCPERLCPHPSSHSSSGPAAAAPPSAASFLVCSPVGCDWGTWLKVPIPTSSILSSA